MLAAYFDSNSSVLADIFEIGLGAARPWKRDSSSPSPGFTLVKTIKRQFITGRPSLCRLPQVPLLEVGRYDEGLSR